MITATSTFTLFYMERSQCRTGKWKFDDFANSFLFVRLFVTPRPQKIILFFFYFFETIQIGNINTVHTELILYTYIGIYIIYTYVSTYYCLELKEGKLNHLSPSITHCSHLSLSILHSIFSSSLSHMQKGKIKILSLYLEYPEGY